MTPAATDPRLAGFFGAVSDHDATAALSAIFDEATERALTEAVRRGLLPSARRQSDAEDIASDTRMRLIRRLWGLRRDGGDPIEDFTAYAATTATRTCYAYLRARFPARTRFRNQVRYSVSHHPGTCLESDADGVWRCRTRALRRAASQGVAARSGRAPVQQFVDAPAAFLADRRIDRGQALAHLIAAVLQHLDAPIELDRLVDALAIALAITDAKPEADGQIDDEQAIDRVPDPAPDALREISDREALTALWREVTALPANQRVALLLNLRDPDGGSALHAMPSTGIVTRPELARVLEIGDAQLDEIWDELPLDDLTIAARLGLTRQQVINLRKSARARLARRTK
jgi:RNA polymerase sigma factor (sigma-70 family)